MKKLSLAAACLISIPTFADPLNGVYVGGSMAFVGGHEIGGINTTSSDSSTDFRAAELVAGYKYNGWLGGEARLGLGVSSDSLQFSSDPQTMTELTVEVDHYQSIYYRAESANTIAKLYGLIGYSNVAMSSSADTSDSTAGPSYGFGVGFVMYEDANLNFEYRQLVNSDNYELSVLSIGFDYRF